ncbi:GNAT family N-acetyltransferase [Nocardia sp. NBC_00508]|uniref:GNAT family N-acetyltransferase n=1 Tax=Nocardia sp. NBC_00508 TaxID=2975992 RepID=UPI002E8195F7|nr:N-acetyltransferase [Nocardia sp. NBC_00508]WUD64472.1 GNAT family N-acetyltransferase [Nocardia sp. NBC_00508]
MNIAKGAGAPVFRTAMLSDLADIAALEQTEFGELAYPYFALRQLFDLHGSHWVVADLDGTIGGYAMVALGSPQCAWVIGLAVAPQGRGRGYGRALLDGALARCRAALVDDVFLTVRPNDQPASNLYKTAGFVWAGHEERYFGTGEPRDVLVRRIRHRAGASEIAHPASSIWRKRGHSPD